jgi:hypothetical protein
LIAPRRRDRAMSVARLGGEFAEFASQIIQLQDAIDGDHGRRPYPSPDEGSAAVAWSGGATLQCMSRLSGSVAIEGYSKDR